MTEIKKLYEIRVAVVGSRNFNDYDLLKSELDAFKLENGVDLIVSGGAKGADTFGEKWAKENNVPTKIYYPDWKTYGKAAGILRNKDIIDAATHVIAFPSKKGRGTQNSIKRAKEQCIPTKVIWMD